MHKRLLVQILTFITVSMFSVVLSFAIDCPEGKTPVTIFKGGTGQFLQVCVPDKAVDKIGNPNDYVIAGECPCSPGFQVPDPELLCNPRIVIYENYVDGWGNIIDRVDGYFTGCASDTYLSVGHDHITVPGQEQDYVYCNYKYEDGSGTSAYLITVEEAEVCAKHVKAFAFALDADCNTNIPNVDCAEALPDFLPPPTE